MLVLTETTDKIQAVLGGAVAANQPQCYASYRDFTGSTGADYDAGRNGINTNGNTDIDLVGSPSSGKRRVIDFLSIHNRDTANVTPTIKLDANGTEFILWRATLAPDERVEYSDGVGFRVFGSNGALKQSAVNGTNPISSARQMAVLGSDVTNNNASANTIADVTGLSFPVTAGQRYYFRFFIRYTSAAGATGSRWSISGPGSPTELTYSSDYSLTTTTRTVNEAVAYDAPAASNATSPQTTAGNLALIEGIILPSGSGNVIARFASEVSASAIVAKAGSFVEWQAI